MSIAQSIHYFGAPLSLSTNMHLLLIAFVAYALAEVDSTVGSTMGTRYVPPSEVTDLSKQMPYCSTMGFYHAPGTKLCASDLKAID